MNVCTRAGMPAGCLTLMALLVVSACGGGGGASGGATEGSTTEPAATSVYVDTSLIPDVTKHQNPVGGWAVDMLKATDEVAPASDIGAFRTGCQLTKFAFDDPIVYPNQPGKSHLHTFFG